MNLHRPSGKRAAPEEEKALPAASDADTRQLAQFSRILESSLNEIYIFDAKTCRFIHVNEGARRNLGYSMEELRELAVWDIKPELPIEKFFELVVPLRTGEKELLQFETLHRRKDGTTYPVKAHLQLFAEEERPVFVAIVLDIMDHKRQTEALQAANAELAAQRDLWEIVSDQAKLGYWYAPWPDGKLFWSDQLLKMFGREPGSRPPTPTEFEEYRVVKSSERMRKTIAAAQANKEDYELEFAVRLENGEERVVHTQTRIQQDPTSDEEIIFGIVHDVTESRRAEGEIRELSHFGQILEASLNEIYIYDAETCLFTHVNEGARKNMGYTMDELHEITAWDIKPDVSEEQFHELIEPLRAGEQELLKFETVHQRKDGTQYPVEVNLQFFSEQESPVFVAIILDMTEHQRQEKAVKAANDELREQRDLWEMASDQAKLGYWQVDLPGGKPIWSDQMLKIYGYEDGAQPLSVAEFQNSLSPEDAKRTRRRMARALATKTGYETEYAIRRPDGEERVIHTQVRYETTDDGESMFGIVQDITARKEAEKALKAANAELQGQKYLWEMASNQAKLGYWRSELPNGDVFMSDQYKKICGHPLDAPVPETHDQYRGMPDEDVRKIQYAMKNLLSDKTEYEIEYRIPSDDGSYRTLYAHTKYESGENGDSIFGVVQDITDRKKQETALEEANQQVKEQRDLWEMAASNTKVGYWRQNLPDGELEWSPQLLEMHGLDPTANSSSGNTLMGRINENDMKRIRALQSDAIIQNTGYETEYTITLPSGEERVFHNKAAVQNNSSGKAKVIFGVTQDITEYEEKKNALRAANAELQGQRNLWEMASNQAKLGYWRSELPNGDLYWSDQLKKICGYSADAPVPALSEQYRGMPDEDVRKMQYAMKNLIRDKTEYEIEYRIHSDDGSPRTLYAHTKYESGENGDAIFGVVQDITERKQTEQKVQELNHFSQIFETALNEIYIFDFETGLFLEVNDQARRNMGYTKEELMKTSAWDINPALSEESFKEMLRPLIDGEQKVLQYETVTYRKDGSAYEIDARLQIIEYNSRQICIAIAQEITEKKAAEAEIRALNEGLELRINQRTGELIETNLELSQALDGLKHAQNQLVQTEKMASLGGLVAGVAHEINTPVGIGVTAASHLHEQLEVLESRFKDGEMRRSDLNGFMDTARDSTNIVLANLQRASELIGSFKQVAVDQSSEERRSFELGSYLEEIVTSLRPQLKKGNHEVWLECENKILLDSYPGTFSQIITNLIMNSLVHAYGEGMEGDISISVEAALNDIVLTYKDDGKGIEADKLPHIFDPFFTTRRGQGGSGLGLNIVYNLVTQNLGGAVSCDSQPGAGTIFTIVFPRTEKDKA